VLQRAVHPVGFGGVPDNSFSYKICFGSFFPDDNTVS
jgi:hypothetical protein